MEMNQARPCDYEFVAVAAVAVAVVVAVVFMRPSLYSISCLI